MTYHRVLEVSLRNLCLFWSCTAGHWRARSRDPTDERVVYIIKNNSRKSETNTEWSKSRWYDSKYILPWTFVQQLNRNNHATVQMEQYACIFFFYSLMQADTVFMEIFPAFLHFYMQSFIIITYLFPCTPRSLLRSHLQHAQHLQIF